MVDTTVKAVSDPLTQYWNGFVAYVPQLVGAIVVVLVGLIVASIVASILQKLLELGEGNQQVQNFLSRWNIHLRLSQFVSRFVWWIVFLVFISAAVDILNIPVLSKALLLLTNYLPSLFAAAVIAVVVFIGARVVRTLVQSALEGINFPQSRGIALSVYAVLMVFGLTAAAAQLGIDTTLLTANITVVIAGIAFAFALAFGLGGRETAGKIVENMYQASKTAAPVVAAKAKVKKRK